MTHADDHLNLNPGDTLPSYQGHIEYHNPLLLHAAQDW
jgi:hypothetical protein